MQRPDDELSTDDRFGPAVETRGRGEESTVQEKNTDQEEPPRRSFGARPLVWGVLIVGLIGVVVLQYVVPFMAQLHATQAEQLVRQGKYEEALERFDKALAWQPGQPGMFLQRGEKIHVRGGHPRAALEDFNHFIEINPHYAPAFEERSRVHIMLGNNQQAIADAREAKQLWSKPDLAHALNVLAYMQALAGEELPEALENVDQALALIDEKRLASASAAYRDTRAYVLHRLNRNEEALPDAEQAVRLAREFREELIAQAKEEGLSGEYMTPFFNQADETIAVLLHHRSLIHEELGNAEQAKKDAAEAKELGFDPARGVF